MKRSTNAAALILCIVIAYSLNVCFPDKFTTEEAIEIPDKHDVFGTKMWFSVPHDRARVDFDFTIVNNNVNHTKRLLFFEFDKQVWYEVDYLNHTGHCTKYPLSGSIQQFCLSKNAKIRDHVTIGAVLDCDDYVEHDKQNSDKVKLDILAVKDINIPVRAIRRDVTTGDISYHEYWNFVEKVDPDALTPPSFCKHAEFGTLGAMTVVEVLRMHNPYSLYE